MHNSLNDHVTPVSRVGLPVMGLLILFLIAATAGMARAGTAEVEAVQKKLAEYVTVRLSTDMTRLSNKEKQMIPILIEVSDIMDEIFWLQVFGDRKALFDGIKDELIRKFALLQYGPWDRLDNNRPFVNGFGEKPPGANFYPKDMTRETFAKIADSNKTSRNTLIRREANGALATVWYHDAYKEQVQRASGLLLKAADLAEDPGLKKYLTLRAAGLLSDDYEPGDRAWMDLGHANLDFIVGPSEVGNELFCPKTAHEAIVLVKDRDWSAKLGRYAGLLPQLQKELPVGKAYKKAPVLSSSDLNAYDAIYCAGDANCGSKTVAICLPSDENLRLKTGARRFLLRNVIKAKYDHIVVPLATELIDPAQPGRIRFEAFLNNLAFLILSEIAYGPGTPRTIDGKQTVEEALGEANAPFVEGKASILGLYLLTRLIEQGVVTDCSIPDVHVAYVVNLLRSIRRGTDTPDGKANMMCFNQLQESGALWRSPTGRYQIDSEKMRPAVDAWMKTIIEIQGDGDRTQALRLLKEKGTASPELRGDLDRLKSLKIPKDVIYEQGLEVLSGNR